jgi:hypothetical protein
MNDIQEKPTLTNNLRWLKLSSTPLKIILTLHIIFSVGLLGDSAGYLAVAIRASNVTDAAAALTSYQILQMFAFMFGIPLSFLALISGLLLGLSTKWGVFRYPWVMTKLLLIISVILVGALVLKEGMDAMVTGRGGAEGRLIAGAAYDVVALTVATVLGVFKPGGRWFGKALNQKVR